ncbi:MAG: nicotinate (nicotinamide) nucleotide adenylyltransferase [Elainella sp.]
MQQIGTLGGTFDPIHRGHLLIAETAQAQLQLDQILWVPAPHPPHKSGQQPEPLLAFEHRLEMVRRAIAAYPGFALPALPELDAPTARVSYAIETLRALQELYPLARWYWIIGLDAFQTLPFWKDRRSLAQSCCWVVAPRIAPLVPPPGSAQIYQQAEAVCQTVAQQLAAEAISLRWQILEMQPLQISSRLIRSRCRQQQPIDAMVPAAVRDYIQRHNLYRELIPGSPDEARPLG